MESTLCNTLVWVGILTCIMGVAIPRPEVFREVAPPTGPPVILSEGDLGEDYPGHEEMLDLLDEERLSPPILEITAVISRSPIGSIPGGMKEEQAVTSIPDTVSVHTPTSPSIQLSWWHLLLLVSSCILLTCLCSHLTGCCFVTADCCSDSYWGCCSSIRPCVPRLKPPVSLKKKNLQISTSCSLNESSTAPRRSLERNARNLENGKGSCVALHTGAKLETDTEEETLVLDTKNSTLQSMKSVRNYKRTRPSPGKERKEEGRSESLPHVYEESGSYFSWLHLLGRSSKRYNVAPSKDPTQQHNNNNSVYRHNTRYRHIPDNSRNSAVIPTKISKRSSTASTITVVQPDINNRSRSVDTMNSLEDRQEPLLGSSRSERNIQRSRISAHMAQMKAGRSERILGGGTLQGRRLSGLCTPVSCPTAPIPTEYNLNTIKKELTKSRETSL